MVPVELITLVLLCTAALFAVVELGISGYVISLFMGYTLGQIGFLLFCSIWTVGVAVALLILPIVMRRKASAAAGGQHTMLGRITFGLNTITMIFWMAGFAAFASIFGGGALLAFAVMLWLIFLALFVINLLTAFGVMQSERLGWHQMFNKNGTVKSHGRGVAEIHPTN